MKAWLVAVSLAAATIGIPLPAAADDAEVCADETGEVALEACTRIIDGRQLRGAELAPIYFYRGVEWAQAGEADKAIADFERSADIDPTSPHVFHALAEGYRARGDHAAAIRAYTEAIELDEEEPNSFFYRASAHMEAGDFGAAIADFSTAIRLDPEEAEFYNARAIASAAAGDHDLAIDDYGFAIERSSEFALAYANRADSRLALGDVAGAIDDYGSALDLAPDDAVTLYKRAAALRDSGDHAAALADFSRLVELVPEEPDAWYERGLTRALQHDLDGAIADFSQAMEREPSLARLFQARGMARQAGSDLEGAIADYSEAIRLDADNAERYVMRAWASHRAGRHRLALIDADRAAVLDPDLVSAHSTRAAILEALGETDAAGDAEAAAAEARTRLSAAREQEQAQRAAQAERRLAARAEVEKALLAAYDESHPYMYPVRRAAVGMGFSFEDEEIVPYSDGFTDVGRQELAEAQREMGLRGTGYLDEATLLELLEEPVDADQFKIEPPWGTEGEPIGDWFFSTYEKWCTIWTRPTAIEGRFAPDFGELPLLQISRDREQKDNALSQTYAEGGLYEADAEVVVKANGSDIATEEFGGDYGPARKCGDRGCFASDAVLKALRAADTVDVVGPSKFGGDLTITYSASGFTKAFRRLDKECGRGKLSAWLQ